MSGSARTIRPLPEEETEGDQEKECRSIDEEDEIQLALHKVCHHRLRSRDIDPINRNVSSAVAWDGAYRTFSGPSEIRPGSGGNQCIVRSDSLFTHVHHHSDA